MALPENRLSDEPVYSAWTGAAGIETARYLSWADGPVAIQDQSEGVSYQLWKARVVGNGAIYLSAENTPEYELITGSSITDVSIAFDQNANLYVSWTDSEETFLRWYDSLTGQTVTTSYGTDMAPKSCVYLDDKRPSQSARSDVIFAYVKKSTQTLHYRQQRDRYSIEYNLQWPKPLLSLERIGMNRGLRLQFQATEA